MNMRFSDELCIIRKISNKYKMLEKASISPHHVEKLLRAYGECLGVKCR